MNTITDKNLYPEKQRDVFASFVEKQTRYSSKPVKAQPAESFEEDIIDSYEKAVKNPHSNAFRYTVAGIVTLVLGGVGLIFGRRSLAKLSENLKIMATNLGDRANAGSIEKIQKTAVEGARKTVDTYYVLDKFSKDTGLMLLLRNIDKVFGKIGFKPGEYIIGLSKWSLKGTERTLSGLYIGAHNKFKNARDIVLGKILLTSKEEQKALAGAREFVEGNFGSQLDDVHKGIGGRLKELRDVVEKEVIDKYIDKYFPAFNKLFSPTEWGKIFENWKKAFKDGNQDVLRENWGRAEEILIGNINRTGAGTFKQSRENLDDIIRTLDDFVAGKGGPDNVSKGFREILGELKSVRDKVKKAVNFEVAGRDPNGSYAGRAIDLGAGGGLPETLIPIVTGGLIFGNTIKNSEENASAGDIAKKFMGSGGFEFLGSLCAWVIASVKMGISGSAAILASVGTAIALNIIKKSFNKATEKIKADKEETDKETDKKQA